MNERPSVCVAMDCFYNGIPIKACVARLCPIAHTSGTKTAAAQDERLRADAAPKAEKESNAQ